MVISARTELARRIQGVASDVDSALALAVQLAEGLRAYEYADELREMRARNLFAAAEEMEEPCAR